MTERDPMFELQDTIESALEAYDLIEDAGENTGAHFRTPYEFLRIVLWEAGYRMTEPPGAGSSKTSDKPEEAT